MSTRVAINGFGRVGRAALRAAFESGADVEFVAINDLVGAAALAQRARARLRVRRLSGRDRGRPPTVSWSTAREIPVLA